MRSALLGGLALVASVWIPRDGPGQEIPLLSTEIRLGDYGIDAPGSVLRGNLDVYWTGGGPRLGVARLRDRPPVVLPLSVKAVPPPTGPEGCFNVDGARLAGINTLGGRFGAYAIGASDASADVGHDPMGRRVMAFHCERPEDPSSPCGLWMQLFDPSAPVRTFVDTAGLATLSMWVSRRPRGAEVVLKAADAAWSRREDALAVGSLDRFGGEGTTENGWERLTVPLDAFPRRLARDSLATLVLEATGPGETEILLAGVELCAPDGRPQPLPEPVSPEPLERAGRRALWAWNTRELIDDPDAREAFLDFVEEGDFDRVFLQIVAEPGRGPERGYVPLDGERMGALVAEIGDRGAATHAMDGDPRYALPEHHEGVLRTVRRIVQHNRRSPPEQRFQGVHYDIEPYLVPGFQGPRRSALLDGFVEVVAGISEIARAADLDFGVAIPFWLDAVDGYTGEVLTATFDGATRPVLDHVVGLVEELAVMDYRTSARGPNGSVAMVLEELDAARDAGAGVWIGVETAPLDDADAIAFGGDPRRGPPPAGEGRWVVLEPLEGDRVRVWLVPEGARSRLLEGVEEGDGDASTLLSWPAGPPVRVPADLQTFHRLGAERMRSEVGWMLSAVSSHPAFVGVAYHHYGTLRELQEGERR